MAYPIATFILIAAMMIVMYNQGKTIRKNTALILKLWEKVEHGNT